MNPPLSLSVLLPVAILVMLLLGLLSWRSSRTLHQGQRVLLCSLRVVAGLGLLLLLLNPGKWVHPSDSHSPPWLLLVDSSASMNQPAGVEGSRADVSAKLAELCVRHAEEHDIPLEIRSFDANASEVLEPGALPAARGTSSRLAPSLNELLAAAAASGKSYSGVIALSDGRQTHEPDEAQLASLILRLRSHRSPFHGVVIGHGQAASDLALIATRPAITGFAAQNIRIPFALKCKDIRPSKPVVRLLDADGKEIAATPVEIEDGQTVTGSFEIPCPAGSSTMELVTEVMDNEVISSNNRDAVRIQVLDAKTRVFLAEGAPYWDSKFLAQLLRQQSHIELHSVHRIANDRYFHINSDQEEREQSTGSIFPQTLEELSQYDLVVFGKNTDAFLDPATTAALRSYVRDRGGAVLFSRGKPTTAHHPGLEHLEPVTWGSGQLQDFRFEPTQDGAAAALFGEALPDVDDDIWSRLPPLKDARSVATVKPFSRVLANASHTRDHTFSRTTPALVVRRYGQGVTGMVNGDGLWKWDFYPEARELGNMYEDFWVQLIQWMASYSEFLPGHDYAIRLNPASCQPGASITITLSYRGSQPSPEPALKLKAPDGSLRNIQPARMPDADNHAQWRASFSPDQAGDWSIVLTDTRPEPDPDTVATLEVLAPPSESDNLSADTRLMTALAEATEGSIVGVEQFAQLLESDIAKVDPTTIDSQAVWQSSWSKWHIALLLLVPTGLEWFLRRRQGLN